MIGLATHHLGLPVRAPPERGRGWPSRVVVACVVLAATLAGKALAQAPATHFVVLDVNSLIVEPKNWMFGPNEPERKLLIFSDEYILTLSCVGNSDSMDLNLLERNSEVLHLGQLNSKTGFRLVDRGRRIGHTMTMTPWSVNEFIEFLEQPIDHEKKQRLLAEKFRLFSEAFHAASGFLIEFEINALTTDQNSVPLFDEIVDIDQLCDTVVKSELKRSWLQRILRNK